MGSLKKVYNNYGQRDTDGRHIPWPIVRLGNRAHLSPIPSKGQKIWDREVYMRSLSVTILKLFYTFTGQAPDSNLLYSEVNFLAHYPYFFHLCQAFIYSTSFFGDF